MAAEDEIIDLKRQLAEAQLNSNRWLAVCQRHGVALSSRFLNTANYNSRMAQGLLDAWADKAIADIREYESKPSEVRAAELNERIAQLERGWSSSTLLFVLILLGSVPIVYSLSNTMMPHPWERFETARDETERARKLITQGCIELQPVTRIERSMTINLANELPEGHADETTYRQFKCSGEINEILHHN